MERERVNFVLTSFVTNICPGRYSSLSEDLVLSYPTNDISFYPRSNGVYEFPPTTFFPPIFDLTSWPRARWRDNFVGNDELIKMADFRKTSCSTRENKTGRGVVRGGLSLIRQLPKLDCGNAATFAN